MSIKNNTVRVIKEGKAILNVPKTVFYNPVQEFNRDLSVLVVKTFLKHNVWHTRSEEKHVTGRGGMKLLDALSASGLRSIRYAKELGEPGEIIKNITANDLSESAVQIIKNNVIDNKVEDRVTVSHSDAITLLNDSSRSFDDRFHIIDIDPFGSGAMFFDSAVRCIGEGGLLMITCTDVAVLCGNASETCFSRYGSMSLKGDFCHEQALRIILRSVECHAGVYGRYIKPLLSISVDFYVRLFVQVFTQQAETKLSASKLSNVYLCKECGSFELQPLGQHMLSQDKKQSESKNLAVKFKYKPGTIKIGDKCTICHGSYYLGGPLWTGAIQDKPFLELLMKELSMVDSKDLYATFRRIEGIIHLCHEELETAPLFYCPETMAAKLRMPVPKSSLILSALVNAGFKVSATHANRTGFKTDAGNEILWRILCQISEHNYKLVPSNPLSERIFRLRKERDDNEGKPITDYDLTFNSQIEPKSKRLCMLRYQSNPEREWGPKSRPAKNDDQVNNK